MNDIRRMYSLLGPYWGKIAIAVAASVGYAAFRLKLITFVKPIIDVYLKPEHGGVHHMSFTALLYIPLLFLGMGIFGYASFFMMSAAGQCAVADLRARLFERISYQWMRFFGQHPTGLLVSRMISDVDRLQYAVSESICDLIRESIFVVGTLGVLFYLDPVLTLMSLVAIPLIAVPVTKLGKRLRQVSRRSQVRMGELSVILHETVTGIRVVKAFGMEVFAHGKFKDATQRLVRVNLKGVRLVAVLPPLMEFIAGVFGGLIVLYGSIVIAAGTMSTGEFATYLFLLFGMFQPLKKLTRVNADVQQAMAAAQRVFEVLDAPGERELARPDASLKDIVGEIRFEHVSFSYDEEMVLSDIDLVVPAGKIVALVGSSGAGKSTLASLIPRFYDPTRGRVLIDGVDISRVPLAELRSGLGLVSQDVILFNDTVRTNITCGRKGADPEAVRLAAEAAHAHAFIEELPQGYETVAGEKGFRLSGGQRQRLAIARAIFKNPPILILDEATSSLDAESELLVQDALVKLMTGRTVLVIAHRFSTIRRADLIVVIEGGRIVDVGTHDDLASREGYYKKYFELQGMDGIITGGDARDKEHDGVRQG